ncbi:MAG: hypothetical protein ABEJ95_04335 [Candidatus Nanohalobium sp.]
MTEFDEFGAREFEDLIAEVDDHSDWKYRSGNPEITEVAEDAAVADTTTEFFIDHKDTDGTLHFTAPPFDLSTPAAGSLIQPVDGAQKEEPYPNSFGEELMNAYQSIAEDNTAEYLEAEATPIRILEVRPPFDYDEDTLDSSLTAASEASQSVQQLNDEIYEAVEGYQ